MNHAADRRELPRQLGKQTLHRIAIGHVTGHHRHVGAGIGKFGGQLSCSLGAIAAPAGQYQMPHPIGTDHVAGQFPAEGPGGARDHNRAAGKPISQRRGHGQNHLADVAGLAHEPQGRRRATHIPAGNRQPMQHVGVEMLPHLAQHLLHAHRACL